MRVPINEMVLIRRPDNLVETAETATVRVQLRAGGDATVYADDTGDTQLSQPLTVVHGRVPQGYVDAGVEYTLYVTGSRFDPYTVDWTPGGGGGDGVGISLGDVPADADPTVSSMRSLGPGARQAMPGSGIVPQRPTVSTGDASDIQGNRASVNATINAESQATTYHVEYGATDSFGQVTTTVSIGSDGSDHDVSVLLTGLDQRATYFYRFVATNATGTTLGSTSTFTTTGGQTIDVPQAATTSFAQDITATGGGGAASPYADAVKAEPQLTHYYRLDDPSGTVAKDELGVDGTYVGSPTLAQTGAIAGEKAVTFDGATQYVHGGAPDVRAPRYDFSLEALFKTTSVTGGCVVCLAEGDDPTAAHNRHPSIHMGNDGKLYFYHWRGGTQYIASPATYNDGNWHHVAASWAATDGPELVVQGVKVAP